MRPHLRVGAAPCPLIKGLINGLIHRYIMKLEASEGRPIVWETLPTEELPTSIAGQRRVKQQERFLKGPIPLRLLQQAAQLPGAALPTYIAARHRADLRRCETVSLSREYLQEWGVSPDSYRRALIVLSDAGLITVKTHIGRATRVTLSNPPHAQFS
jgi:hypothetical protein